MGAGEFSENYVIFDAINSANDGGDGGKNHRRKHVFREVRKIRWFSAILRRNLS